MPDLTVITTLYNCEKYVEQSIKSVINQTYDDFNWILLNDGSTDATWDIVRSFEDPRMTLIDSKDNQRIPRRRNQCIGLANSKYVCIHDGDDISLPHRFERQMEVMKSSPDLFCCGAWAIAINDEGERQETMNYPALKHSQIVNQLLIKRQNPMIDPTTMFKQEDFVKLHGYTLEKAIYTVPDMDLWARAMLDGKIFANIPEPLIEYRFNPDGMTMKHQKEMIGAHMVVWKRFRDAYVAQQRTTEAVSNE